MNKIRFDFVLTMTVLLALAPAASHAQSPKIMLLGDSITHGDRNTNPLGYANGGVGFRYPLYFDLVDNGFASDFVGSLDAPYHGHPSPSEPNYPRYYSDFDKDHEGHAGYRTDQIINNGSGFTLAGSLATNTPDVVSVHIGTNDILQGRPLATAVANVGTIIDTIRAYDPDTKVLLSQIIPLGTGHNPTVVAFNADLTTLVASKNLVPGAAPVALVDQFTDFDEYAMTFDRIHPNVYGERLMADRYFVALQELIDPLADLISPSTTIGNHSFEDLPSLDGGIASRLNGAGRGQAFAYNATPAADAGVLNPLEDTYVGAGGVGGVPQGADGELVAYLSNVGDLGGDPQNAASISQQLGSILVLGTDYTMSVAVGNRLAGNPYGSSFGGYVIELLAGDTVIGMDQDSVVPAAGTFANASFAIDSDLLPSNLYGSELSVRLRMSSLLEGQATDFDNIRLSTGIATTAPEPTAVVCLTLGCALAIGRRRNRRR